MTTGEPVHQADHYLAETVGGAELEELGERIAELAAQISAATYELLAMLRDFDARGGWNGGFHSCAHWLTWRVGLDPGAAREKMRVARALGALPLLSAAMRRGEISYSKVRALTRIATPATEEELLRFGRAGTAARRRLRWEKRRSRLTTLPWSNAAPMPWAWWPRALSPRASIQVAVATATRWWCTSTPRC